MIMHYILFRYETSSYHDGELKLGSVLVHHRELGVIFFKSYVCDILCVMCAGKSIKLMKWQKIDFLWIPSSYLSHSLLSLPMEEYKYS